MYSGCGRFFQQLGAQEMMYIVQDVTTTEFSRRMGKKLVLSCPYYGPVHQTAAVCDTSMLIME